MKVFLNGRYIDERKARLSIHDHGFLYGDGVYETMRVYGGRVFLLNAHLSRLQHSLDGIQLKSPISMKALGRAIEKTSRINSHTEAVVRLTISRGPGEYGFDPALCGRPTVAIVSRRFKPYPVWYHERGITVALVSIRRNNPASLPPHVKSTSCMNGILAKMESLRLKAQEGLMLTQDGFLSECTVSNIFLVRRGALFTPRLSGTLLAGTTRGFVCDLARKAGLIVREVPLRRQDLVRADEAFLTNTTMEVLPVTRLVDGTGVRTVRFRVGPVTKRLMTLFKEFLSAASVHGGKS